MPTRSEEASLLALARNVVRLPERIRAQSLLVKRWSQRVRSRHLFVLDVIGLALVVLLALTAWPESDAVVPRDDRGDHPLCAIYRREACLAAARANLAAERLALRDLLSLVDTQRVALEALGVGIADADVLTNINTPEELATLEGL